MSRYPGTQFRVIDNSNATAIVPISQRNNLAPVYLTTFRAPKGPEEMRTVYGQDFYDLYGTQNKIIFSKYGQPLLQASMDINAGATLIAKRAVLEDAKLANATVGVVLCKQQDFELTYGSALIDDPDEAGEKIANKISNGYVTGATVKATSSFYLRPVIVSIADKYINSAADDLNNFETKNLYRLHRNKIIADITGLSSFKMDTGIVGYGDYYDEKDVKTTKSSQMYNGSISNTVYTPGEITNGAFAELTWTKTGSTKPADPTYTAEMSEQEKMLEEKQYLIDLYNFTSVEYFFPLFTIFDNGRGDSIKRIAINLDEASTKTLRKAVYTLKVSDYETDKNLESFSFTIDPYTRNNSTGYTFDIESAVNLKSEQIQVTMHYDVYDKLVQELHNQIGTDEYVMVNSDCLFGYRVNGSITGTSSYNGGIPMYAGINNLYVDATSAQSNLDDDDMTTDVIYYYYNYRLRYKNSITEKLLHGYEGSIDKTTVSVVETTSVYKDGKTMYDWEGTAMTDPDKEYIIPMCQITSTQGSSGYNYTQDYNDSPSTGATVPMATLYIERFKSAHPEVNFAKHDDNGPAGFNEPSTAASVWIKENDEKWYRISVRARLTDQANMYYTYTYTIEEMSYAASYQKQYRKFFNGDFDKDIFNLDVWFPTAVFDANYDFKVKLAIERLVAYRGDFLAYLDMKTDVKTIGDVSNLVTSTVESTGFYDDVEFPPDQEGADTYYVHDMHVAVTSIYGSIRDPYTNKVVTVTGTYGLSLAMVNHYISGPGKVFAGIGNGIFFNGYIEGTVNFIPKIYPSNKMTSRNFIGNTYPSDDEVIVNEKQLMCDMRVNYGSYYGSTFVTDTQYTMNPTESEFSYINNVMLVNRLMQDIRKTCPSARYNFIDGDDLTVYQDAVNKVIKAHRSEFASVKFKYIQDENSVANKIFYAAIEVVFRPFAQAEIFTITALNYSTLDSDITTV